MKFRCERDVLVEALGTAGRATASRGGALPVLAGIRTELVGDALTLTGHDLELTIAVTITEGVKGSEDGVAVLPSRLVSDVVKSLPSGAVEVDIGDLPACQADPRLLKQVYANLLGNALKFSQYRDPAVIRAGAERRDGATVYFVADNGAGFDMRYADKLFGVFQRLHRADEYEGTGVGLAIVQRIVHRHGGEVWAEAAPGEGATFFFTLEPTASP